MSWLEAGRLEGECVVLEPLARTHVAGLAEAVQDGELWRLWYTPIPTPGDMASAVEERLARRALGTWAPFAVVNRANGAPIGMTALFNPVPVPGRVEIGGTWYAKSRQRTGVNADCKLLLLRHAFGALGCIAVELRTHAMNQQSRRAIEGIGAKLDGILRNHHDTFGNPRDTCVYSIIVAEWPAVSRHLTWRLNAALRPADMTSV